MFHALLRNDVASVEATALELVLYHKFYSKHSFNERRRSLCAMSGGIILQTTNAFNSSQAKCIYAQVTQHTNRFIEAIVSK